MIKKTLESPLIKMPVTALVIMFLMPPNVRDTHPPHELRQRHGLLGPRHEMPVINHQTPRQQVNRHPLQRLAHDLEKRLEVSGLMKNIRPRVAAV